jgi:competence protein ComGC
MKFEDINERIRRVTEEKHIEIASEPTANATGPKTHVIGMVVSLPGSEKVMLDATTFQLMECDSSTVGKSKRRYCIVEKNTTANYGNQFINSKGERAHVITHDLFLLLYGVMNNASKQINDLRRDNNILQEQKDLYKGTIDTLRKNGIIE